MAYAADCTSDMDNKTAQDHCWIWRGTNEYRQRKQFKYEYARFDTSLLDIMTQEQILEVATRAKAELLKGTK